MLVAVVVAAAAAAAVVVGGGVGGGVLKGCFAPASFFPVQWDPAWDLNLQLQGHLRLHRPKEPTLRGGKACRASALASVSFPRGCVV